MKRNALITFANAVSAVEETRRHLLLDWASTYRSRQGSSSYGGHQKLFDNYVADKQVLRSRDAVMAFLGRLDV